MEMTRIIFGFVISLLTLAGCSKEEELPPFIPWNPDSQEEETISLDDATQVMILPEQAGGRVVMIDVPTGKVAWEWKPEDSGLSSSEAKWFNLPDEAKPVLDKTCLLVTASGGGVALIRISDKKALFYANPGGNPHSAEILPDKAIAVASSTGNKLTLYKYDPDSPYVPAPVETYVLPDGHNVVWDGIRKCLWSASVSTLYRYSYDGIDSENPLSQTDSYDLPTGNSGCHDLQPVYGEDALYVTSVQNVYRFDCRSMAFSEVDCFVKANLKSISSGPEGYPTIVMRPTSSSWWSAEVCDVAGNRLFNRIGYQIYKARWYVDNPFGYPDGQTLQVNSR